MNTESKKALLADVRNASRALGRVVHCYDLNQLLTLPMAHADTLRDYSMTALAGLVMLDQQLTSEIGTDNL
jgi:hypothetical protein